MALITVEIEDKFINEFKAILKNYSDKIKIVKEDYELWSEKELDQTGRIDLISKSFEEDDEDYSKW